MKMSPAEEPKGMEWRGNLGMGMEEGALWTFGGEKGLGDAHRRGNFQRGGGRSEEGGGFWRGFSKGKMSHMYWRQGELREMKMDFE
jgi:hypothetical protein